MISKAIVLNGEIKSPFKKKICQIISLFEKSFLSILFISSIVSARSLYICIGATFHDPKFDDQILSIRKKHWNCE